MDNHLIIGIGGTGGKIIRALRKTIYQEFRQLEPTTVNVRFLYIDSSKEMMALDDPTWRTLGKSVQLDKRNQLLIAGANLNHILANLDNYPQIRPWIGNREQWHDILNGIVGEVLGGQKRRLGRFLFACHAADFKSQLRYLANDMQTGGLSSVTFHVCCGLAGGTGSGSLIDILAQVRHLYRDSRTYKIIVYTFLPEEFPKANWDTGNYHANGYAALAELNSLSVGRFCPHDVAERGEPLRLADPFNGCYLFTNKNLNGLQVDVDHELPNIVADFLFQKIIAATATNWSTPARMENAENGDGTPESRPGSTVGERSKRFLTFGIKRLAIPEEEIREYLTYRFARQATLQLRFNNWSDSLGFLDEPRRQDFGVFVQQPETLERWMLSDDHLSLSRGILAEEISNKRWKPIRQEWMDIMPEFVTMIQSTETKTWLNELEKLCAQRFDETYRSVGVRKFYESKMLARREHAREIRRHVETELMEDWKNGVRSLHDTSRLVDTLIRTLEERLQTLETRFTRAQEHETSAAQKVVANRAEWAKVGILSEWLGKRRSLLDAQTECLRDLYLSRTQGAAWEFAKRLLQEIMTEITDLGIDMRNCATLLDESAKEFNDRIAQRCNDSGIPDLRQAIVRFYNADKVKDFARDLDKDRAEQVRQAQGVRLALLEHLGDNPTFAAFHTRIPKQRFFDVLEQQCEESAEAAHNNLITINRSRSPLFGVNIVGALEREFSGNAEGLRTFIHDLVSMAGTYLDFDASEVNRIAPGIPSGVPTKVSQFIAIIPRAQEHSAFAEHLKHLFSQQLRGDIPTEIIESDSRPHEITLVGITNLFPLRYIKPLTFLKERYDLRLRTTDKPDRVRLELHCAGDGTESYDLFVPAREDIIVKTLPYILLAKMLQIIQPVRNEETGSADLYLVTKDEYGLDKYVRLGRHLPEIFESLDILAAQQLEESVEKLLATPEYRHQDKRAMLITHVQEELRTVLAERRGNVEDEMYKRFSEAARRSIQILQTRN